MDPNCSVRKRNTSGNESPFPWTKMKTTFESTTKIAPLKSKNESRKLTTKCIPIKLWNLSKRRWGKKEDWNFFSDRVARVIFDTEIQRFTEKGNFHFGVKIQIFRKKIWHLWQIEHFWRENSNVCTLKQSVISALKFKLWKMFGYFWR